MKEARIIQPMQSLKWIKGVECNQRRNEVDYETKRLQLLQEAQHTKALKNPKAMMLIGNKQKTEGMKANHNKKPSQSTQCIPKITQKHKH